MGAPLVRRTPNHLPPEFSFHRYHQARAHEQRLLHLHSLLFLPIHLPLSLSDSRLSDHRRPQRSLLSSRLLAIQRFHPCPRPRQLDWQPPARSRPKSVDRRFYGFEITEFIVILSPQSSMRSKANSFLRQFMGSGSARDKRRALSLTGSLHPTPSPEDAPPVPAIPSNVSSTPVADVFMSPSESSALPPPPSKSITSDGATIRPRPPTKGRNSARLVVGNEKVTAASIFPADYAPVARSRPPTTGPSASSMSNRRRSVSVGSIEMSKLGVAAADLHQSLSSPPRQSIESSQGPPQLREWDISVLDADDFSGAFKGLTNPISTRKDREKGTAMLESRSKQRLKHQLQPPSRPSASSDAHGKDDAPPLSAPSVPRTSESSTTSSATVLSARRASVAVLAPGASPKESLRLVANSSLHPHHRAESVPLPDTPEGSNGSNMRPPPSPTLSTPSEDVFYDAESTRSSLSTGYTGYDVADGPKTPVVARLQIPSSSASSSSPSTPDGRLPTSVNREPRVPVFPSRTLVRLPTRTPNPFNPNGYGQQALAGVGGPSAMRAAAASTPALVSTNPNPRAMPALRSASTGRAHSRHSPSRSTIAGSNATSSASQMDVKSARPGSLDVRLPRGSGRDHSDRVSPIQPRTGASSSDPALIGAATDQGRTLTPSAPGPTASAAGYVGEDGTLISQDGNSSSATNRTIRLVGAGASVASVGATSIASGSSGGTGGANTLGSSSIYTHSYAGASSAVSMTSYSQTDLILSRHPSSNKMAQAAAAGATADSDELEARAKVCAEKCWSEDETFVPVEKIAEWLGGR